jgi:hypothetical protein
MKHSFLSCVALATAAAAQTTTVFPWDHGTREGYTYASNWPVSAGISRAQLIYSKWRTPIPNGAQISRVGIRPDVLGTGQGYQLQLEIWMAHSENIHSSASGTFANNYATPAVRVFDQRIFSLPTMPAVPTGPNPNYVWFPLDRSFTYDRSKHLIVEYRISANSNGNAAFSYLIDYADYVSDTVTFGTACPTSGQRMPAMSTQPAHAGGSLSVTLSNAPASSAGAMLFGLSRTTWSGVPLPLPLAFLGAGTCSLQVSIDVTVPIMTNTGGAFSAYVPVPDVLALYGTWFHVQSAVGDLFANPAGFVTSASAGSQIGVLPQATIISAVGSATAPTGSRAVNYGLVSLFEY